jgi:hypothetical protein
MQDLVSNSFIYMPCMYMHLHDMPFTWTCLNSTKNASIRIKDTRSRNMKGGSRYESEGAHVILVPKGGLEFY